MNEFEERILEKLSEHSILLATISSDISGLRRDDTSHMDKIDKIENRLQFLERLTFVGFVLIVIMAVKLGLSYLLDVRP
jgi:hypothetical protein